MMHLRSIWAIAWKDFWTTVTSPIYFVVAALCTVLWSFSYLRSLLQFVRQSAVMAGMHGGMGMENGPSIHMAVFVPHISFVNLVYVLALPALTMRLLAEEKKANTFTLLLTSPITSVDVALGKFFGGFAAALALTAVAFLYPLGTALFADFQWAPLLTSWLGLVLMTGVYVAVGLFASSLTQSVMLSVILGVIFNLILWFVGQGAEMSDAPTITAVLEHLSIGQHLWSFIKGTLSLKATLFFLTTITFFVFLSERVVESARWR